MEAMNDDGLAIGLRVVMTDAEHGMLVTHIARLVELDPEPNTPAGVALTLLAFICEAWEKIRFAMPTRPDDPAQPTGENMVG